MPKIISSKSSIPVWCFIFSFCVSVALCLSTNTFASPSLSVLDISERTYDNGPAIGILFSQPLDPNKRHDRFINIRTTQIQLKSAWVLSADARMLYFAHAQPDTTYHVTVNAGLPDAAGNTLVEPVRREITTRKITPGVAFAGDGILLPLETSDGLPIIAVNVPQVDIEFFRMDDDALIDYVTWRNPTGSKSSYLIREAGEHGKLVYSGRFELDMERNQRLVRNIAVKHIRELQAPGLYLAVMRQPGQFDYAYQATYFLVTDIALQARVYPQSAQIIASSLDTGQALGSIDLFFYDEKANLITQGQTDEQGFFQFNGALKPQVALITAEQGTKQILQIGMLPLTVPALDLSEFDIGLTPAHAFEIFAYGPRNLYRPGETIDISALLRNADGRMVAERPLFARLIRPDGREIQRFTWHAQISAMQFFHTRLALPEAAQTGRWRLDLRIDPAANAPDQTYDFQVETFLPERLALTLTASAPYLLSADPLRIQVQGNYLYGAAAGGNRIDTRLQIKTARNLPETYHLANYEFGDIDDSDYRETILLADQALDDQGRTMVDTPSRWRQSSALLQLQAAVSLYDSGGRPVTRTVSQWVWPRPTLVGVKPRFTDHYADEGLVDFDLAVVTATGELTAADNLDITVLRHERDGYWELTESDGWKYRFTDKTYPVQTDLLTIDATGRGRYQCQLTSGRYTIKVRHPQTSLITSVRFYVGQWADKNPVPDRVKLILDKPSYHAGETVAVNVVAPHDGQGIILVESDRMLFKTRLALSKSGTRVNIPVAQHWDRHDIYITAVALRPGHAAERITPARAIGMIHLPLNREQRQVELTITAPPTAMPDQTLAVTVDTPPAGATDTFVTLAVVDEGILRVNDFQSPDPFDFFFGQRRYAGDIYDIYAKVVENMAGAQARIRWGGDADITPGGMRPDAHIELLSRFYGPVQVDAQGQARFAVDLPDYNGQVRLMAIAFSADQFGMAENRVTVAAPVVSQINLPRFLAPGDVSQIAVDVRNMTDSHQSLSVDLSADDLIEFMDPTHHDITLAPMQRQILRLGITARPGFGAARMGLQVNGGDVGIDRHVFLPVRPAWPAVTRKSQAILPAAEAGHPAPTWKIDPQLSADLMSDTTVAHITLSTTVPLNIKRLATDLDQYPYGCAEQVTSRAWPLLNAQDPLWQALDLTPLPAAESKHRLDQAIYRLTAMQLSTGGFGLWSAHSPEDPWLTCFIADFLLTAALQHQIVLPDQLLARVTRRMTQYLGRQTIGDAEMDFVVKSYSAYNLSRTQAINLGTPRLLFDQYASQAPSALSLTHLGLALKNMGDRRRSEAALSAALQAMHRRLDWGDYGSALRDQAMIIYLLLAHGVHMADLQPSMTRLSDTLSSRFWLSTQEQLAVFLAGTAMQRLTLPTWQARLSIGEHHQIIDQDTPFYVHPTAAQLRQGITFDNTGSQMLFGAAVVNGYPQTAPPPDFQHIRITRTFHDVDGNLLDDLNIRAGAALLVCLDIEAGRNIPDAMLIDLLPGGFEIENPNLDHSLRLDDSIIDGKPIWQWQTETQDIHQQFLDDRYIAAVALHRGDAIRLFYILRAITPGTYALPPTLVESMYRPHLRGIGAATGPLVIVSSGQ